MQKAREGQIPRVTQQFADHINQQHLQQQQQQLPNHFSRINIKQSNPLPAFMNKPNPNEIGMYLNQYLVLRLVFIYQIIFYST